MSNYMKEIDRLIDEITECKYWLGVYSANEEYVKAEITRKRSEEARAALKDIERRLAEKQAVIDRLMLEYCPDEMTTEQRQEWAAAQKGGE